MKGVVFLGDRKLELREFPDPTPGARDVILEIKASGMCGSDLHNYRALAAQPSGAVTGGIKRQAGVIAGHEPCGVVAALGAGVTEKEARVGQRVMDHHYDGCGACKHCRAGWTQMCLEGTVVYGSGGHGGHARYMKVPVSTLVPLPGRALLRDGRGDLLRHRHGLGRAEAGQPAGRRDHRHLRPGPGRAVGDAARGRDGRARHRHRRRPGAAPARPGVRRARGDRPRGGRRGGRDPRPDARRGRPQDAGRLLRAGGARRGGARGAVVGHGLLRRRARPGDARREPGPPAPAGHARRLLDVLEARPGRVRRVRRRPAASTSRSSSRIAGSSSRRRRPTSSSTRRRPARRSSCRPEPIPQPS